MVFSLFLLHHRLGLRTAYPLASPPRVLPRPVDKSFGSGKFLHFDRQSSELDTNPATDFWALSGFSHRDFSKDFLLAVNLHQRLLRLQKKKELTRFQICFLCLPPALENLEISILVVLVRYQLFFSSSPSSFNP
ncbi:unnamed protein product [Cochlearia groenlandica]